VTQHDPTFLVDAKKAWYSPKVRDLLPKQVFSEKPEGSVIENGTVEQAPLAPLFALLGCANVLALLEQ
jgi:hypothetical protein